MYDELDDSDLYEGFDEDGNRITEDNQSWSYGTVQPPPQTGRGRRS